MDESKGRVLRYREFHSKRPGQGVTYSWDDENNSYRTNKNTYLTRSNEWLTSLVNVLREIFLPEGYPHTVSDDYLAYQVWDTIQAFARCVRSVLNKNQHSFVSMFFAAQYLGLWRRRPSCKVWEWATKRLRLWLPQSLGF